MQKAALLVSFVACLASTGACAVERYPERPIRLVVPAGAGGNTDTFARILAEKLRVPLGQQVIVDNRPGADGIIGTDIVAKARPDGYTLVMVFPSHPVNPFLHEKLPYDTLKDLVPISMITSVTQVLVCISRSGMERRAGASADAARDHRPFERGNCEGHAQAEAAAQGVEAIGNSPAEFDRVIRDDIQKWAKVLKGAGAR